MTTVDRIEPDSPTPVVRIAVTLASAASLGSYQAGAVAALLVAVQAGAGQDARAGRAPRLRVDAIGATSAGALVGLLAARCLQGGLDPVHVLHEAWVRQADWRTLRSPDGAAPLSLDPIEGALRDLLDGRDGQGCPVPPAAQQPGPLVLRVAVGSLRALTHPLHRPGAHPITAMTHVDGSTFVLEPGAAVDAFTAPPRRSPLDLTLASISHPALFPPRLLDRRGPEADHHAHGPVDLPADGLVWCSDGSALLSDPLGRTLAAARRAEELSGPPGRRMHVLVHPHTAGPEADERWAGAGGPPAWPQSATRLLACLGPEPVHEDLRRATAMNARVRRAADLVAAIAPHLPEAAAPALAGLLDDADRGNDVRELLHAAVAEVADLDGAREVDLEVVSPVRLLGAGRQSQTRVGDLVAGDALGRFGGFLDRERRRRDFVTGWRSTRAWLPGALERSGLPAAAVAAAVAAVDDRAADEDALRLHGPVGPPDPDRLPLRARVLLARTGLRAARIALRRAVRG